MARYRRTHSRSAHRHHHHSPRRLGRGGLGSGAIISIICGAGIGLVVMVAGFVSPYQSLPSVGYRPNGGTSIAEVLRRAQNGDPRLLEKMAAIQTGGGRADLARLIPFAISASNLPEGISSDVAAYQQGRCNATCKNNLKSALQKSLGSNWRSVVERYRQNLPNTAPPPR